MKYVKMLGLASVAVAALMAFVGSSTASATVLCTVEGTNKAGEPTGTTCPANEAYKGGTKIHAEFEATAEVPKAKLTTSFQNIECEVSTVAGETINEGSATETVKGIVTALTFEKCNCEVKVLKNAAGNFGELEIHWGELVEEGGKKVFKETGHGGTLTSTGSEVTAQCNTIFGKVHCIYKTNATDIGNLTGSAETISTATMDIEGANIPRLVTDPLCAEKASWDAHYKVDTPDVLNVAGHT